MQWYWNNKSFYKAAIVISDEKSLKTLKKNERGDMKKKKKKMKMKTKTFMKWYTMALLVGVCIGSGGVRVGCNQL